MLVASKTRQLTVASIFSAIAVVFMIIAEFTPMFSHVVTWVSAGCLVIILKSSGQKMAILSTIVIAILGWMMTPSLFGSINFVMLYGTYPIVKIYFDKIKNVLARRLVKAVYFVAYTAISIALSFFVFGTQNLINNFEQRGILGLALPIGLLLFYASWYDWFFLKSMDTFWENKLQHLIKR